MSNLAREHVEAYLDAVLPDIADSGRRDQIEANARNASAEGALYGPFANERGEANGVAAEFMSRATVAIREGLPEVLGLEVAGAAEAMDVMLGNCVATNEAYPHQRAVRDGQLDRTRRAILEERFSAADFVGPRFAMSQAQALDQVIRANAGFNALRESHPKGQLLVANVNYAGWTGNIMTTGVEMLADPRSLADMIEQEGNGMAHLRASNFVLGSGVRDFASHFGSRPVTWIDLGSGTGATVAAGLKGIQGLDVRPKMKLAGIEGTQAFHAALLRDQGQLFDLAGQSVELDGNSGFVFADMVDGVQKVVAETPVDSPIVVTANFALHRLSTDAKAQIFQFLAERPVVALLVGDLHRNGSPANRGYFNFGFNGPSNCGHLGTGDAAHRTGFTSFAAAHHTLPGLDGALRNFVQNGPGSDAHVNFYGRGKGAEWANTFLGERR